jgi:hypothetical protein
MAIDFGLANQQPLNGLQALQYFGQAQQDQLALQQQRMKQATLQRQEQARPEIAGLVNAGDYEQAQRRAVAIGDTDYAKAIAGLEQAHREQLGRETETIGRVAQALRSVPIDQRMAQLEAFRPQLNAAGISDQELTGVDVTDNGLNGYISLATTLKDQLDAYNKANEPYTLSRGQQRFAGGQVIAQNTLPSAPDYVFDPESGDWLLKPGTGGSAAPVAPPDGASPASFSAPGADQVWQNIVQIESGGRPGVLGPQTRYGRAQGMTQMLPATAQQMAQKLGVPWQPELMTATTPEGAAYQQQLGRAYFDEGVQRYGGDLSRGAMYYHGGPDESIWGPRTRAYAARATGAPISGPDPRQGGQQQSGGTPTRIPSGRGPRRQQAPSGYQYDGGGNLAPIRGGPADPGAPGEVQKSEMALRKEFDDQPAAKAFATVRPAFNTLARLANAQNERVRKGEEPSAADDIAIVFAYMKLLDPSSVVRENEYATAKNAAGVPERIRNQYNQLRNGSFLAPNQRANLIRAAQQSYQEHRAAYNGQSDRYRELAREYGFNENRIAPLYLTNDEIRQRQAQRRGGGQSSEAARLKQKYGLQ